MKKGAVCCGHEGDDEEEAGAAAEGMWRKQKYEEGWRWRGTGSKEEMTGNDARKTAQPAAQRTGDNEKTESKQEGGRKRRGGRGRGWSVPRPWRSKCI